jgi:hypothetical protein
MRNARSTTWRSCAGGDHLGVIARDVHEQRVEVDLLLEVAAQHRSGLLADDRDDRLMIGPRIVESGEEVDCTGTGGCETDAGRAGEFRVPARHEGAGFLVPPLDERDRVARAIDGADHPVDAVAGIAIDARDAPNLEALDQCVGNGACHAIRLAGSIPPAGRRLARSASAANDIFLEMQLRRHCVTPSRSGKNYAQMVQVSGTPRNARTVRAREQRREMQSGTWIA